MVNPSDSQSRRKDARASCSWRVRVVNAQKKQFIAKTLNVSQGGVMLEMAVPFHVGENLYLDILAVHNGKKLAIEVVGKVTYAALGKGDLHHVGLKFATDTSKFRNFLREYVAEKAI